MKRRRCGILTAAVLLVMGISACSDDQSDADAAPAASDGTSTSSRTVPAERRDIASVIVLDATAVAGPKFAVQSTVAGTFRADPAARPGLRKAGTRLGWVTHDGKQHEVMTPAEATLESVEVTNGATVQAGMPLAVLKLSGFAMAAAVSETQQYRVNNLPRTARGQIENGPGPFDCPVLGVPDASASTGDASASTGDARAVTVLCKVPNDVRLFPGLKGLVALNVGEAKNVLALPVEAVAGSADSGRVLLEDDGKWQEKQVKLGLTDGSYIEIRDGLSADASVRVPGPNLPARS